MKDMTRSQLEEYDAVTGGPHFVDPLSVVALFHFFSNYSSNKTVAL